MVNNFKIAESGERVFLTNGGGSDSNNATAPDQLGDAIKGLPVIVDFIKVTRDGKLQISLIGDAIRGEELEKIRDLLLIQQGRVYADFTPEQGELSL